MTRRTPTIPPNQYGFSLAIGSDGNLYAWGDNSAGELGDGTTTDHDTPEAITLASGVKPTAIAAGRNHSLAIGSDGNLYAWGDNSAGELGDGTTTDHDTPEVISLGSDVVPIAVAAGDYHSLVIGTTFAIATTSLPDATPRLAVWSCDPDRRRCGHERQSLHHHLEVEEDNAAEGVEAVLSRGAVRAPRTRSSPPVRIRSRSRSPRR